MSIRLVSGKKIRIPCFRWAFEFWFLWAQQGWICLVGFLGNPEADFRGRQNKTKRLDASWLTCWDLSLLVSSVEDYSVVACRNLGTVWPPEERTQYVLPHTGFYSPCLCFFHQPHLSFSPTELSSTTHHLCLRAEVGSEAVDGVLCHEVMMSAAVITSLITSHSTLWISI